MFITTRTCGCGKHQLGVQCTYTHTFTCKDCDPHKYLVVNNQEL